MPPFAYLQFLFFISEVGLLLFKRSKKTVATTNRDKRSLLVLWVVIAASLSIGPTVAAYDIGRFNSSESLLTIGMIICIAGFVIRWTAILQLGKMFTVDVAITAGHTLKTTGLYKIVRHPSYLGLMLIIAGLAVCMNNLFTILLMVLPTFIALNYRIKVEEIALTEEFGDQYNQYKSKVAKIIPGIY